MADFRPAAHAWERILFASGGLLILHKCYWWSGCKWKDGMHDLLEPTELNVSLALKNGNCNDTEKSTTQQMGPNNVNVDLGFHMDPIGTQRQEINIRKKQSDSLAVRFGASHLNHTDAWVLYSAVYTVFQKSNFHAKSCPSTRLHGRRLYLEQPIPSFQKRISIAI